MQRTLKRYEEAERKVADSVDLMMAQGVKKVVFLGNTEITDLCLRLFARNNGAFDILGVVDPTGSHPRSIHPLRLGAMDPDAIFLCDSESKEIPKGLPVWKL